MKKSLFILIGCLSFMMSYSQDNIQGTIRSEAGQVIGVYITPTSNVVASNTGNVVTFNIAVSIEQSGFGAAPVPVVSSLLAPGIIAGAAPGSPTLESGRYVYTYIMTGNTAAFTWNAGVERPVIKLDFETSSNFNGNFPRLQNDPSGGPTFQSYFYTEVNSADLTNYGDTFYGGNEGNNPVPYVEALQALPVQLIAFNVEKSNEVNALLTWSTSSELNSSHFNLQRSFDKRNWSTIGKISAHGNSQFIHNYEFVDNNVYNGKDKSLTAYYRLQMVDIDLQSGMSPIKSVTFGSDKISQKQFDVYPNPASDGLQVTWDANMLDQPTSLEFYDIEGKLIFTRKVSDNTNQEYIDLGQTNLQAGLYLLRIMNGTEPLEHRQIVVQR